MDFDLQLPPMSTLSARNHLVVAAGSPGAFGAPCKFIYVGHTWDTVEAALSYTVAGDLIVARRIKHGELVSNYTSLASNVRTGWSPMRLHALHTIVLARFLADDKARAWLLETGDAMLLWVDPADGKLGCVAEGRVIIGCNEYGRVLMAVRRYLARDRR